MNNHWKFIVVFMLVVGFGGKSIAIDTKALPELKINRPTALLKPASENEAPEDRNEIYTKAFRILSFGGNKHSNEGSKNSEVRSVASILEKAGVEFPVGTNAELNEKEGILTVTHNAVGMEFVRNYLESMYAQAERYIKYQLEIYRLPALLILKLQESADNQSDHKPERDAVLNLVKEGQAHFVKSVTLESRSGQRSKFEDVEEYLCLDRYEWRESANASLPFFESRKVGTIFEVDSILSADTSTIDINFGIEHHTAPPGQTKYQIRLPNTNGSVTVTLPIFHMKKIVTQIHILDGSTRIVAVYRPTGKPEYKTENLMEVIFLKGNVMILPRSDVFP
ncbi:MAG: hypothetical protein GXP30_12985 [Verrucomicrobia bacterium]|nr:hypothetical protein [Verrucomicrobiota bacterium]